MADMNCGIYKLTSPSGKFYIGSSCHTPLRLRRHRKALHLGAHPNGRLQNAFNKHGHLKEEIILVCRKEDLLMYEQICMDALSPDYNCSLVAGKVEMSKENRAKISAALKGRKLSPEHCANMGAVRKGKKRGPFPDGWREKISASKMGKSVQNKSPEARAKLRAANLGKKHSPETKAKLSAIQIGKKLSPEHRAKIAAGVRAAKSKGQRHG